MESASMPEPFPSAAKSLVSIKVEYRLDQEDYVAWWLHAWERSLTRPNRGFVYWFDRCSKALAILWMVLLAFLLGVLSFALAEKPNILYWPFAGAALLILLMVVLALIGIGPHSFARKGARRLALRRLRRLAERTSAHQQQLVLTPDQVIEIIEVHRDERSIDVHERKETVLDWSMVVSIDLAGQHVFFITKNNLALIVPQRAFTDEKAFLDFVETAWIFHRQVRETSPTTQPASSSPLQADQPDYRITTRSDDRIVS